MRRQSMFRVVFVLVAAVVSITSIGAQVGSVALDSGWEFRQSTTTQDRNGSALPSKDTAPAEVMSQWRPATVPGDVHLDLLAQKLIPDPFFGTNESKLQWISEASWEYRKRVEIPAAMLSRQHLELVFDGLDTYALVYLNDKLLLTATNQFRIWRVDVKGAAKSGANELRIVFPAQDKAAESIARRDPWYGRNTVAAKTYIRKAAYEHGWDWGPTFVTSGIWRPVRLESWTSARIADFHVRQMDVSAEAAHLSAEVEIEAGEDTEATVEVTPSVPAGSSAVRTASQKVTLHPGRNTVALPLEIARPARWFPAGYGAQPLYRFTATLHTKSGDETRGTRIGLRSLELRRDVDKWGRSFEFIVNGIPIYAKGADVIPSDSFANRVTHEKYRAMLQSAKDSNMNMVRLWGGGYYEADDFYDLCDELGILIWHDFMFGNDWQPGSYDFGQNVEREAEDQLRRLRNHPSIALWCGNNETEMFFRSPDRDKLDTAGRLQVWQDYLTLFHGILARSVARFDPEVPYWPSSPSADLEATSPGYESGDQHLWDVWHGRVPFSTYETHHARFVSEYGFQSFPELRTVESFTTATDRTGIFTPVMLAHQKNNEGNELIQIYLLRDYPTPKDFPSFLYVSQVLQAEGVKIGAEHLRRERPRNMGSIYWQLNDCWPVASWASIDSFGRWKALQFYARRFYAPVFVSPHVEDGRLAVYAVSDRTEPRHGTLTVRHLGLDGTVISEKTLDVTVPALSSTVLYAKTLTEMSEGGRDPSKTFVSAKLALEGEPVSENLTYLVPTRQVQLPTAHLTTEVGTVGGSLVVKVRSDVLARSVLLSSSDEATTFADNYFDLLPGQERTIAVSSHLDTARLTPTLTVRSLDSAFATETPSTQTQKAMVP